MLENVHEECGVFGVYGYPNASQLAYYGLHSLQHRGQEAAGIVSKDNREFYFVKKHGLVSEIFHHDTLEYLKGNVAIGHVRYATAGGSGIENVQPFLFKTLKGNLGICHNGNLINWRILKQQLEDDGAIFQSTSDTEIIGHLMMRAKGRMIDRIKETLRQLDGGFALLILHEEAMYGCRDNYGLRPLVIGQMENGAYVLTSETCALDIIGATYIRDVEPGEIVRIKDNQILSTYYCEKPVKHHTCIMEYIYFARPDSAIEGISTHLARTNAGRILFEEQPCDGDVVIGVPDSSLSAAIGYSLASGIPYEMGLIKNKYVGRTFIQPTQKLREQGVRMKLSTIIPVVKDKRVIMIDDSIVRGTTSQRIVKLLREAGAKEVHVKIASCPFKFPCFYGVDFATYDELIANNMTQDELCEYIEADSLQFISLEGLKKSVGSPNLCMACLTGEYPTKLYEADKNKDQGMK